MLSRMREKYDSKGVEFVGISIDNAAKISEFSKTPLPSAIRSWSPTQERST